LVASATGVIAGWIARDPTTGVQAATAVLGWFAINNPPGGSNEDENGCRKLL
jgi:hypothetical protein